MINVLIISIPVKGVKYGAFRDNIEHRLLITSYLYGENKVCFVSGSMRYS